VRANGHIRDHPFNLLVIEAKKTSSRIDSFIDQQKLDAIKAAMGYRFAAFVSFAVRNHANRNNAVEPDWFELQ
jgi:hypothetical protein